MTIYRLIRTILFKLPPETAHRFTLNAIQCLYQLGIITLFTKPHYAPRTLMGLTFPNPLGLAAGCDVNANYIDALLALGFGFIEVGTVTPQPQPGNPKPRLFRLIKEKALINRMGFCNHGVEAMANRLANRKRNGILGINIGKNKDTPLENAIDDYLYCFHHLWQYADYITLNISSPNTPGLRILQQRDYLEPLLKQLKHAQHTIFEKEEKYVPLVVKLSPDITQHELSEIANVLLEVKIDGVIATNTTIDHASVAHHPFANEAGGLSGKPLSDRSTTVIKQLFMLLENRVPIIGLGGIMDAPSAQEKLAVGAQLLQVYTGFVYKGPRLISECLTHYG